ncbi:sorting nexin-2-like isoform X2 [Liolophura sinensis]|uniref:sorting nexin-2-like isoform X2 n=1 Tax=Liolophura sinensis TaxID=3198878 RepID=UPI0031592519
MADDSTTSGPPPLDDGENEVENDDDDLFASASDKPTDSEPASLEISQDKDSEDLFTGGGTEVNLDSDEEIMAKANTPGILNLDVEPDIVNKPSPPQKKEDAPPEMGVSQISTTSSASRGSGITKDEIEEEQSGDSFDLQISVTEPHKVGDGMTAYMSYKVVTRTSMPAFRNAEMTVNRRFSDFLGLHDKLAEKYACKGRIVPAAPEKSIVGMTKIKMSKEESGSSDFVERRRIALERYLQRTAQHHVLRMDPDFREFLEQEGELPRATNTSALSGAGVLRLFHKVGDAVEKITFKMDETDEWFEDKSQQVEALDQQLRKLHTSMESLVAQRRELSFSTANLAKSTAMLGNAEEHTALSRALSQLAEVEEKVEVLHKEQSDSDLFTMAELLKDYISLIAAVKDVFHERVKCYKNWKDAEAMLNKKRETKAKLELSHKQEKLPQASQEITEWEQKVEKGQEDFEKISETIRKEMARFEKQRVVDFKENVIKYLEKLMENQQQLIKYWEAFLPEAKAIA